MTIRIFPLMMVCALVLVSPAVEAGPRSSLFFTPSELAVIMRANRGFIAKTDIPAKDNQTVDRGRRIITLSGIVYEAPNLWTIWLNGERVTPKNIPAQVRGLLVNKDRIHLRWEDTATQRIVNLTLRPHQQYNLDLDTISPGT